MDFKDIMVIITGILCFLVGILMVPLIDSQVFSSFGYNLPAALIGVIDLVLIIAIIYLHTIIVLYNQKRKCKTISEDFTTIFKREGTNEDES